MHRHVALEDLPSLSAFTVTLALLVSSATAPAVSGERPSHSLADGLVTLEIPQIAWQLRTDDQTPPTIATIEIGQGNRARIGLQPATGLSFGDLVTLLENSLSSQYPDYEKIEWAVSKVAARQVLRTDGTYSEDGVTWRALGVFTLTQDGQLFSFSIRVHPDELESLQPSFDSLIASLEIEGRAVVGTSGSRDTTGGGRSAM